MLQQCLYRRWCQGIASLEQFVHILEVDGNDEGPLYLACHTKNLPMVSYSSDRGVDMRTRNKSTLFHSLQRDVVVGHIDAHW